MIYICIPSHDEAPTVGLLLWKLRRVFEGFAREYQLLVCDDGSTDDTAERLEPYSKVLPLTLIRHAERQGYARSVEELLRQAVELTDRPKRDCAVLLPADFAFDPEAVPELIKRIESGADLVLTESRLEGEPVRGLRWVRRLAPYLLRGVRVPGARDVVSGLAAFRLVSLKNAFRAASGPLLSAEGWAANAELAARVAQHARRIEVIPVVERHDLKERPARHDAWQLTKDLWREGGRLKIKVTPGAESPARPREDKPALEEATR